MRLKNWCWIRLKLQLKVQSIIYFQNYIRLTMMNNLEGVVKSIINIANKIQVQQKTTQNKNRLPDPNLSQAELFQVLKVLAQEYQTDVLTLIRKLDRTSGNINDLDRYFQTKDEMYLWSPEEDQLLNTKNQSILIKYKGKDSVQARKKYLAFQIEKKK